MDKTLVLSPGEIAVAHFAFEAPYSEHLPQVYRVGVSPGGLSDSFTVRRLRQIVLSGLVISSDRVYKGDPVIVQVTATNVGDSTATETVTCDIPGELPLPVSQTLTLPAGVSVLVTWGPIVCNTVGPHSVVIDGLSGQFEVIEMPVQPQPYEEWVEAQPLSAVSGVSPTGRSWNGPAGACDFNPGSGTWFDHYRTDGTYSPLLTFTVYPLAVKAIRVVGYGYSNYPAKGLNLGLMVHDAEAQSWYGEWWQGVPDNIWTDLPLDRQRVIDQFTLRNRWLSSVLNHAGEAIMEARPIAFTRQPTLLVDTPVVEGSNALLKGNVSDTGGVRLRNIGFVWDNRPHSNPLNTRPEDCAYSKAGGNYWYSDHGIYPEGAFEKQIGILVRGRVYFVRACGYNGNWSYSGELAFMVPA